MFTSLKNIYREIRVAMWIFLIAAAAMAAAMMYAGVKFIPDADDDEAETGLVFTKLTETLYSLVGDVAVGDCEKIVPQMPTNGVFTVILESQGGSLQDGSCLAASLKIRNVVTVIRDTAVLGPSGEVLYQPDADGDGRVVCASACSLMFLGGDMRYLIGDSWLGIHGPRSTAPDSINPAALEASAYRTAASLLLLLEQLGVSDPRLRLIFIQIPASTMYWLNPKDFENMPSLLMLATNYVDFHGFTAENPLGSVGG